MLDVEELLGGRGYGDLAAMRGFSQEALLAMPRPQGLAITALLLAFVANEQKEQVIEALVAFAYLHRSVQPGAARAVRASAPSRVTKSPTP